ncbi:MAG: class I SAM-dependent methyltransferase [Cytophagales bacterium]
MGWSKTPYLEYPHLFEFSYLEDLNQRKLRDAEVILGAALNSNPKVVVEIGTAEGRMTSMISENIPDSSRLYTLNIPPEEIKLGGKLVTGAYSEDQIGRIYKEKGCKNVIQILKNSKNWEPNIGVVNMAFIDGSHDAEFVYSDTLKILKISEPGTIIIWHDFNPYLIANYAWIKSVCLGVDQLFRDGHLVNKVLHLQDSWTGLYIV